MALKVPGGGYYMVKACVAGRATILKCKSCQRCDHNNHKKTLQQYLSGSQDGKLAGFKAIVDECNSNTYYKIECLFTMFIPFEKSSQLTILP